MTPVAHAGDEPQTQALYVPKGIALWAGVELRIVILIRNCANPVLAVQGGYY